MQYISFAFTAVALLGLANSSPVLFEAATRKQALGLDPIPAQFGSGRANSRVDPFDPNTQIEPFNPAAVNTAAANSFDVDTAYSVYRSDLQTLAREISGRVQRTSNQDFSRRAFETAQTSLQTFRQAARPTATVCAALRLVPAEDQATAIKYVSFVQHTADNAYQHTVQGMGESAYWDFCLIDDYMTAVSSFIELGGIRDGRGAGVYRRGAGVYNGKSIGTY